MAQIIELPSRPERTWRVLEDLFRRALDGCHEGAVTRILAGVRSAFDTLPTGSFQVEVPLQSWSDVERTKAVVEQAIPLLRPAIAEFLQGVVISVLAERFNAEVRTCQELGLLKQ